MDQNQASVTEKQHKLNSILEKATMEFFASNHLFAIQLYEKALSLISTDPFFEEYNLTEFDICVIEYSLCSCYITREECFQKASDQFVPLVLSYGDKFPPLYYGLAKLCFAQHYFKQTENVINNGLKALNVANERYRFAANWPGTDVPIPESDCGVLTDLLKFLKNQCLFKQNCLLKIMDSSDVYQSDEYESDDMMMGSDKDEDVHSIMVKNQAESALFEDITNQEELFNRSGNDQDVKKKEKSISNVNVTEKRSLLLNANVPEFIPRGLRIDSCAMDNLPAINIPSPSLASGINMSSVSVVKTTPAADIEMPSVSEVETMPASDIKKPFVSDVKKVPASKINIITKPAQHLSKGCQTIAPKMMEKSVQTRKPEKESCNCKQQMEEREQALKAKVLSIVNDNKKLYKKMEDLQEEYRQKSLQDQQRILIAENTASITSVKLEAHREGYQEKLTKFERKTEAQKNKIQDLLKNIQIMHSVLTTQSMHYFNFQSHIITNYLNKCQKMISDLTVALPYINVNTIPTLLDYQRHIEQWQTNLQKAQEYSTLFSNYREQYIKDLRLGNFTDISNPPEFFTQLTESNDILHDSYLPAVSALVKENVQHYQQNFQFQQQYSQWWNTYGRYNQMRAAVLAAPPLYYNVPQNSTRVQINDVTRTTTKNSVVATSPDTNLKSTADNSSASEQPEIVAKPSTSNAESATNNSKSATELNETEPSTLCKFLTNQSETYEQHENRITVKSENETSKMHEEGVPITIINSNEPKKDEKCDDNAVYNLKAENSEMNETSSSDYSKLKQIGEKESTETSTDSPVDCKENIESQTKPWIKSFKITSSKRVLQHSVMDETEEEPTLNNALRSDTLSESLKDQSHNVDALSYSTQILSLDGASNFTEVKPPPDDLHTTWWNTKQLQEKNDSQAIKVCNPEECASSSNSSSSSYNLRSGDTATAACNSNQESANWKEVPSYEDFSKLPEAVKKAGRSFCDLYVYVKERIPGKADVEIFSALKRVRRKLTKLSGMTKDAIVAAVKADLNIAIENDGKMDAPVAVNSEATANINLTNTVCIVCIEQFGNIPVTKLYCKHTFHTKCIEQWFKYRNDCPICRIFVV